MYKWVLIIWALSCFPFINAKSQNTSNKGKEFWIAYTGHVDGLQSKMYLYVTSDVNTTVDVKIGGLAITGSPFTITANTIKAIPIDPVDAHISTSDVIVVGKAIEVTATQPVVVYSHIFKARRSAATLVLPTKVLGREYYTTAYTQNKTGSGPSYSEFTVVAVEDNTVIEITPKAKDIGSNHLAGVVFQKTLQKGEIYQYQSETDLSGSHIISIADANGMCKPIAVFSGSTWLGFCGNNVASGNGGDNLYQQLYPVTAWGKEFITAPFIRKPYDVFRIYFSKDNTELTINGGPPVVFNKGTFFEFSSAEANSIKANEPISVVQYQISQNCDPANADGNPPLHPGDPEMTVLSPVEQTLSKITLYSALRNQTLPPTDIIQHYINIIIKDEFKASFTINGLPPEGVFVSIAGTGYSYLQEDVTTRSLTNPMHTLMSDGGFSAIAYGYGTVESYGYLAGADAKNLYENLQIFDTNTNLQKSDVCVGEATGFTVVLPFQPLRLIWTLDGNEETAIDNPVPNATEVINGVQVYKYNYGSNIQFNQAGAHQIKATIYNPSPSGCDPRQEIVTDFEAFALPKSDFLPSTLQSCVGTAITFSDRSIPNGKNISKWYWNFDDGSNIPPKRNAEPFNHIYTSPGDYYVTLMVETESGCSSPVSDPIKITVNKLPEAKFNFTVPGCETNPITFTDESIPNEGVIIKWNWDFGDVNSGTDNLNTSTLQHPTHTFSTPGTYNVVLTVETDKGCSAVLPKTIIINKLPVKPDFEIPAACSSDAAVKFINTSVNTIPNLRYEWEFGDPGSGAQNTSTNEHGEHQYTAAGDYTVKFTVFTPEGCPLTTSKTFRVNGSTPVADFEVLGSDNLCSNREILVKDNSRISGFDRITRLEWYINGVLIAEKQNPVPGDTYSLNYPAFSSPSIQQVPLKLIAFSGAVDGPCQDPEEKIITLHAAPLLQFDAIPPVCLNAGKKQIVANESGTVDGEGVFSGPGISSAGLFDPKIVGKGTWKITYTYTSVSGCIDAKDQFITVNPIPKVDVESDVYAFVDGIVQVKASTTESGLQFKWSPSKGLSRDDVLNPVMTADEDRLYTLKVTSPLSCCETIYVRLHVLKDIVSPNAFSPNGDNVNDVWKLNYLESYPNSTVSVFNRYGEKVFFSHGYSIPFDGNYKGKPLPVGTYYYVISPGNGKKSVTGSLTLIR
jgi:gliding motility-associated-like protein